MLYTLSLLLNKVLCGGIALFLTPRNCRSIHSQQVINSSQEVFNALVKKKCYYRNREYVYFFVFSLSIHTSELLATPSAMSSRISATMVTSFDPRLSSLAVMFAIMADITTSSRYMGIMMSVGQVTIAIDCLTMLLDAIHKLMVVSPKSEHLETSFQ